MTSHRPSHASPRAASAAPGAAAMSVLVIIPARLGSTRLERKMLLRETGKYLFEHTARRAASASSVQRVLLATDSREILEAAQSVGLEAAMTSSQHQSGTDRCLEALEGIAEKGESGWDIVINVQGDEPELPGEHLDRLVAAFGDPSVEAATLCAPIDRQSDLDNPAVVKLVCDAAGDALYFSRAAIPSGSVKAQLALRHVGVYAYRPPALKRFCSLPRARLELVERLEQLRWLEAGQKMRCIQVHRAAPGIDTLEQYTEFKERALAATTPEESGQS